jgi:8-oxo-dGTP pyrophosphatase MutT (NUDIX family)
MLVSGRGFCVMRYGISAAALIVQNDRVLLVNHMEPGKYDFWVPPGGSLSGSESILDCARRETLEETGLTVELGHILYIQEFWELGYHFCKFFILCTAFSGDLTRRELPGGCPFLSTGSLTGNDRISNGTERVVLAGYPS